jgi:poly-gamma-glutamate capsule biosynthesis protein CapA/YwtB (metallophosphatase superfamily)
MQRVLKCDGVFVEKINQEPVTPQDIRAVKAFLEENRQENTSFDIVATGNTSSLSPDEQRRQLLEWEAAGATWWIEGLWEASSEQVDQIIALGPPQLDI